MPTDMSDRAKIKFSPRPDLTQKMATNGILGHAATGNASAIRGVQKTISLAQNGQYSAAKALAKSMDQSAAAANDGYGAICGPNPPRDFRRPVVFEDRAAQVTLAGGTNILENVISAAGLTLNTVANQKFLQASDSPAAGISMRAQVLGRRLIGLGVDFDLLVQNAPGGAVAFPDEVLTAWLTQDAYKCGVAIFPTSSNTPLMDFTNAGYFKGGEKLMSGFETPVVDDNFHVRIAPPDAADYVGSTDFSNITIGNQIIVTARLRVTGVFLYDID